MTIFYGRYEELERMLSAQRIPGAKLFVVMGRRRIGKSSLINQFAKDQTYYCFMGLAPDKEKTTAQDQRDEFSRLLSEQTGLPEVKVDDWGKLFSFLGRETRSGKVVVLLDEISWMADKDDTFLSKLKSAWDMYFSQNSELTLVLCGSVSSWIQENIISSTGFLGRPALELTLEELPLETCIHFWGIHQERISAYEKFKILSVTGGVPRYLELVDSGLTAEKNIQNMCFIKDAILSKEFKRVFSDVFGGRSQIYLEIVQVLMSEHATMKTILAETGRPKGGDISDYLDDLVLAGFVKRDFTWNLRTGKVSKLSKYRLSDNYLRFYLKYIHPNLAKINKNLFKFSSLSSFPGWDGIMGLQFQNVVLNNEQLIIQALGTSLEDIVFANPYYQTSTKKRDGCQIDYLIQTKYNNVFVCEIRFSKKVIGSSAIEDVKEKISRLKLPKNYSYRPVLIHVNGVTQNLVDQRYFEHVIDYSKYLMQTNHN